MGYQSRISGRTGRLAVHHVHPFQEILDQFLSLHPDLDPDDGDDRAELLKLALSYEPFWNLNNGVTMLREEHLALHYNHEDDIEDDND